jgi:hypothetical protein
MEVRDKSNMRPSETGPARSGRDDQVNLDVPDSYPYDPLPMIHHACQRPIKRGLQHELLDLSTYVCEGAEQLAELGVQAGQHRFQGHKARHDRGGALEAGKQALLRDKQLQREGQGGKPRAYLFMSGIQP